MYLRKLIVIDEGKAVGKEWQQVHALENGSASGIVWMTNLSENIACSNT